MDRFKCEICGRMCYGLMDFAGHTAQSHRISALSYWEIYGHHGEKGNKNINPSARNLQVWKNCKRLRNEVSNPSRRY